MAGSGLPPLPNIPYCCLPQESGPCLSTSVGDRPLRSPTHRRPGGPSPRLPSNGTHARPPPRLRLAHREMPPKGRIRYYPAFPPAIPVRGAGCIRVAHPSATLNTPKGVLPYDLHVLGLPLAFILSQDQTLRCNIVFLVFLLNLGFRLPAHRCAVSFLTRFLSGIPLGCLCWPQTFKELRPPCPSPRFNPSFLRKRIAKLRPFSILASDFFNYFRKNII